MVMVVPGKDYTKSWNALADVFGNYAQTRDNAYQRQRQEILDAQNLAYHQERLRSTKLLGDTRAYDLAQAKEQEARNQAARDALLTKPEFVDAIRTYGGIKNIPEMKGSYGSDPSQVSGWDEIIRNRVPDTGIIPNVNRIATAEERHGAQFDLSGRLSRDQVLNLGSLQSYKASLESERDRARAANDVHRTRLLDEEIKTIQRNIAVATEQSTKDYAGTQAEASASRAETAALTAQQKRKWDESVGVFTGDVYKPGVGPRSSSDAYDFRPGPTRGQDPVDPRYFNPDDPEWKQAAKYYAAYGPKSQVAPEDIVGAMSDKRNWATSLDKSGYTIAQTNTLADTFAPQFETQFDDADQVTKRESEQMANYALAAAKQIFNNPDIQLPRGMTALNLYNQILNQRDLYAVDTGWLGNDNYEPITEVATIIENWQNLNTERGTGTNQGRSTSKILNLSRDERKAQLEQLGTPVNEAIAIMRREGYFN